VSASARREVGALDAALVTVGAMIGSGIFYTPAEVARLAGSTSRALAVWVFGAVLSLLGALSLAELGAAMPGTGGLYLYLRRALGPSVAFLFGWAMLVVLVPSSIAFFAGVCARHLAPLVVVSPSNVVVELIAVIVIVAVAGLNIVGVRVAARVQGATALARTCGLVFVALAAFVAPATPSVHVVHTTPTWGVLAAVVPVLWAYDGWIDITSIAGEVRDPAREVPRALIVGTLGVALVYVVVVIAYHHTLGTAALAASDAPGRALGARIAGHRGANAMTALVALSTLGGCMIGTLTGTRVIAAMASSGDFLSPLGALGRTGTPNRAIVVTSALAVGYVLSSQLGRLAEMFVVGAWPFYALGALATMVLRDREPSLVRPYRVPGYPFTVLGFLFGTVGMLLSFAWNQPRLVLASAAMIMAGLPLRVLLRRFTRET
jgi:APA family basic amino acid/polyamine antiporter